jgi:uncharacterized protein (DUF934 family)
MLDHALPSNTQTTPQAAAAQRSLIVNQAIAHDTAVLGSNLFTLDTLADVPTDLAQFGLLVGGDCDTALIKPHLSRINLIAVEFPKVVDGRGYSLAYLLRNRLNFTGELRAVGDFTRDQLFFLGRTGFNAMTLRAGENATDALTAFNTFSVRYQGSNDTSKPLFVQTTREANHA